MPELRTKQATSLSATLCSLLALILAMIFSPAAHAEAFHLSAIDGELQLGGKMQYLPAPTQSTLSDVMGWTLLSGMLPPHRHEAWAAITIVCGFIWISSVMNPAKALWYFA